MGLPAAKFDTLSFAKALRDAGVNEKQAEVYAEKQAEIIQMLQNEQLVTKDDIHRLELEVIKAQQASKDVEREIKIFDEKVKMSFEAHDKKLVEALSLMEINLKQEMKELKGATVKQLSVIIAGLLGVISLLHWMHVL